MINDVRSTMYDVSSPQSNITVKLDGRSFSFTIPTNSDTSILDAAMQQGADVPYACKGGVCCTCKARLLEGEVSMDVHWGLEQEEIEQGYILTIYLLPDFILVRMMMILIGISLINIISLPFVVM